MIDETDAYAGEANLAIQFQMRPLFTMVLIGGGLAGPLSAAAQGCDLPTIMVCTDAQLRTLKDELEVRRNLLEETPMHQAFRSELEDEIRNGKPRSIIVSAASHAAYQGRPRRCSHHRAAEGRLLRDAGRHCRRSQAFGLDCCLALRLGASTASLG
jgi:hypothetical protein